MPTVFAVSVIVAVPFAGRGPLPTPVMVNAEPVVIAVYESAVGV